MNRIQKTLGVGALVLASSIGCTREPIPLGLDKATRIEIASSKGYKFGEKRYLLRVEEDSGLRYFSILGREDLSLPFDKIIEESEKQIEFLAINDLKSEKEVTLNKSARKYSLVFLDVYSK